MCRAGLSGEQGLTGLTGEQGPTGLTGEPGPTGPTGVQGSYRTDRSAGLPGEQGPRGEVGPTSDKCPTGDQGPVGERGEQGPAAPTVFRARGEQGLPRLPARWGPLVLPAPSPRSVIRSASGAVTISALI
jgi:hypothetical protein